MLQTVTSTHRHQWKPKEKKKQCFPAEMKDCSGCNGCFSDTTLVSVLSCFVVTLGRCGWARVIRGLMQWHVWPGAPRSVVERWRRLTGFSFVPTRNGCPDQLVLDVRGSLDCIRRRVGLLFPEPVVVNLLCTAALVRTVPVCVHVQARALFTPQNNRVFAY